MWIFFYLTTGVMSAFAVAVIKEEINRYEFTFCLIGWPFVVILVLADLVTDVKIPTFNKGK